MGSPMKKTFPLAAALLLSALPALAIADTPAPYAGQQHRAIKALSAKEIDDLRAGRGMGLAKAAELNGYPGPMHVLELADKLSLSPAQRDATEALFEGMRAEAQRLGAAILEAERALDQNFAGRRIDEGDLQARLAALGTLQGELRFVHLRAHLAQAALLSADQRARYDALRGYATSPEGGHAPHGTHRH
jgi:Spy/CpxP family protein refolding chaperone